MSKVILQNRDFEILAALLRYKYLSIDQIHDLFFPDTKSNSSAYAVLNRLIKNGYIDLEEYRGGGKNRIASIYFVSGKGVKILAEEWKVDIESLGYKRITNPIRSSSHYNHRHEMINFWIELDRDLAQLPHLELKEIRTDAERDENQIPITKISTKDKETSLVPDFSFIIQNNSSETPQELLFLVEIDMGTVSIGGRFGNIPERSMTDKFMRYEKILADGHWKQQYQTTAAAFEILTVTTTTEHLDTMRNKPNLHLEHPDLFYFSTHEVIKEHGIVRGNSWIRSDRIEWENILY